MNFGHYSTILGRTFAFLGRFPIHGGPTPTLTPQTMWDACIQNFFRVSTLYRVEEEELQENFEKVALFYEEPRMIEESEYCITVPRTFVHDCRLRSHLIKLQKLLMEVTSALNSPMVQARIGRKIQQYLLCSKDNSE